MIRIIGLNPVIKFLTDIEKNASAISKKAIVKSLTYIEKGLKRNTTSILKQRSGDLHKSIDKQLSGQGLSTLTGSVWIGTPYATTHEFGATITAKNAYKGVEGGPYLNIPIPNFNTDSRGLMKQTAREVFAQGGYVQKSKKGNWLVFSRDGKPMFLLRKQVTIPARLGMFKLLDESIPILLKEIEEEFLV